MIFLPFCYPKFSLWYNHAMRHCITKQDVSREWGFSQPAKMQNCHTHIYELKRGHFSSLERQYFAQFLCISFLCFDRCTMGNLVLPWFHLPYITCTTSTLKMEKKSNFLRCGLNFWQQNIFLKIWSKWKSNFRIESSYS